MIQYEPLEMLDAETRRLFASIGIQEGKEFAPDERMQKILADGVAIGNAASRVIVWYPRTDQNMAGVRVFPDTDSAWLMAYTGRNVFFNGEDGQTMNTDARVTFHYPYTAVPPRWPPRVWAPDRTTRSPSSMPTSRSSTGPRSTRSTSPRMSPSRTSGSIWQFNRITGGKAATVPPERGFKQGRQEARRGANRRGNARMSGSREDSRVVGEGDAQELAPSPVALVDGEVRYHRMR